ncbi:MAG: fibronectin type III domain-containing protein [Haliscomenobacter sp.]|nr:fibronectin type III domain-containing protein [Haliscomenobacter sp.]MBK9492839.1 fibronectin type III domain-containing protein [Haliscomenobacter sp.]
MTRLVVCFLALLYAVALEAKTARFRAMWRDDPATSMVIAWDQLSGTTPMIYYDEVDNGQKAELYKLKRKPDQVVAARGLNNHFARLSGLKPTTVYFFVVKDSEGLSRRYSFRTVPNLPTERLSIISGEIHATTATPRISANTLVSKYAPFCVVQWRYDGNRHGPGMAALARRLAIHHRE